MSLGFMVFSKALVSYCIVFVNLYSADHSNGHSVALPVREPLEKKKVLRREKAVGRDPEIMVTRRGEGRAFHREGPIVAKDLVWAIVVLTRGTKRACLTKERRGR